MVLDQLKSSFKKWRGSTSREQRIIPEEISLKGTSASLCADEGKSLFYCITVITKKLQKRKGHKHDCGRPGINGGYIGNTNIKYGVNCYGYKPKITDNSPPSTE